MVIIFWLLNCSQTFGICQLKSFIRGIYKKAPNLPHAWMSVENIHKWKGKSVERCSHLVDSESAMVYVIVWNPTDKYPKVIDKLLRAPLHASVRFVALQTITATTIITNEFSASLGHQSNTWIQHTCMRLDIFYSHCLNIHSPILYINTSTHIALLTLLLYITILALQLN